MTNILLVRRPRLGAGSSRGMKVAASSTTSIVDTLMDDMPEGWQADLVVRWGCTASTHLPPSVPVMNKAAAIQQVNNKMMFARQVYNEVAGQLPTITSMDSDIDSLPRAMESISSQARQRWVLRSRNHAQGRRMYKLYSTNVARLFHRYGNVLQHGWYARPRIEKAKEFRVYVVAGKVACVAEKTPGDPTKTAWNVARGGRFDLVRWGDWPLDVCDLAIKCFNVSELDFGGVDVMVEAGTNKPYFIEINTAPSLPLTSDGGITSRHRSMMGAFEWHAQNGIARLGDNEEYDADNWRRYIHPGVWGNHVANQAAA